VEVDVKPAENVTIPAKSRLFRRKKAWKRVGNDWDLKHNLPKTNEMKRQDVHLGGMFFSIVDASSSGMRTG